METKELKIHIPKGYEIDEKNSTFKCIKFIPIQHLTIKDVWEFLDTKATSTFLSAHNAIATTHQMLGDHNKRLSKVVAYAALSDIAEYYNRGWKPDWANENERKFCISCDFGYSIDEFSNTCYGNIYFQNYDDAKAVINNPSFRKILDTLFKA